MEGRLEGILQKEYIAKKNAPDMNEGQVSINREGGRQRVTLNYPPVELLSDVPQHIVSEAK